MIFRTPLVTPDGASFARLPGSRGLSLYGSTSGYTRLKAPAVAADKTFTLPDGYGTAGHFLKTDGAGVMSWDAATGVTDHGALTGLTDDDHSIYPLLLGRATGQTLIGGTASGDDMTLKSTSHATKGNVFFGAGVVDYFDEVNLRWRFSTVGIGAVPSAHYSLLVERAPTETSGFKVGVGSYVTAAPGSANTTDFYAMVFSAIYNSASNGTGKTSGVVGAADKEGAGTLDELFGGDFAADHKAGTTTEGFGIRGIARKSGSGTLTTGYGGWFSSLDGATNWALYCGGGDVNLGTGYLKFDERSTTPANPASSAQVNVYLKADTLVFQFNDGGTVRYKSLVLSGTGVTWVHSTTAP